jgi:ribonuclease R
VHRVLADQLDGRSPRLDTDALHPIAEECSDSERRAADAERELVEWKKIKFMIDRVGDQFKGLIISTTRFGFFVELEDLFVEGLVPIETLPGERWTYQENTRKIAGERTRKEFAIGDRVEVILDRVDGVQKKLQFSLWAPPGAGKRNNGKRPARKHVR